MARVELKNVGKVFRPKRGQEIPAVQGLNLDIATGELVVILGPSGCGKTTTLRIIAGLEEVTTGTISFDGAVMNSVAAPDRDVAMVFQRDTLYPHMSVLENMAFGLSLRRVSAGEIKARVQETATLLDLAPFLERFPRTLSGGQRQRVALGRALIRQPKVFLLDEPLSHLDPPTRTQLRTEIACLHQRIGTTMLYVTHEQSEAMTLGRRVVVMNEGLVQQVADPFTLYHQPANLFVAGFVGSPPMNLFHGRITRTGGLWRFEENNPSGTPLPLPLSPEQGEKLSRFTRGNIVLGLRPEYISVHNGAAPDEAYLGKVDWVETLGAETHVHLHTGAHRFIIRTKAVHQPKIRERVPLRFDMAHAVFFDPDSERAIETGKS